ncbi:MAG: FKBP-type peptidyl-prolyl cis-trans isomerase [Gammaproteobacteria bacterium]|nr:FKBP-type peptidyl-prolyl cis-trans isomerase [Gammaproteobacteria bacterium]
MNIVKARVTAAFGIILLLSGCDVATSATNDEHSEIGKKVEILDQNVADKNVVNESDLTKASYLIGFNQAQNMVDRTFGAIDLEAYAQGVQDQVAGAESVVDPNQGEALMTALGKAVEAKQAQASEGVRTEGEAYRTAFAAKQGVVTLPSGLLYQVMHEGNGAKPAASDTVVTHYHGMLIDGTVFDSSVDRGEPASFAVNGVIRGWTEALQLMATGSKWRLVIPPELAYGASGSRGTIPPHATLEFEVELLEIK